MILATSIIGSVALGTTIVLNTMSDKRGNMRSSGEWVFRFMYALSKSHCALETLVKCNSGSASLPRKHHRSLKNIIEAEAEKQRIHFGTCGALHCILFQTRLCFDLTPEAAQRSTSSRP